MSHYKILSDLSSGRSAMSVPSLAYRSGASITECYAWTVSSEECRYSRLLWECIGSSLVSDKSDESDVSHWSQLSAYVKDDLTVTIEVTNHNSPTRVVMSDMSVEDAILYFDTYCDALAVVYADESFRTAMAL